MEDINEDEEKAIKDDLDVLNYICKHNISSVNTNETTYPLIKSALYPHQLKLVDAMFEYYHKISTSGIILENQTIFGNMGIIADPPGSGKKMSILAFISKLITSPNLLESSKSSTKELNIHSKRHLFSLVTTPASPTKSHRYVNIIIVAPHLFYEWKMCIENYTGIDLRAIETMRSIKKINTIKKTSLLLTTSRCFKHLQKYANTENIMWNHVFIGDSISHIFYKNDFPLDFCFCWITYSNWVPLVAHDMYNIINRLKAEEITKGCINLHKDVKNILKGIENYIVSDTSNKLRTFINHHLPQTNNLKGVMILRNSLEFLKDNTNILDPVIKNITCSPSQKRPFGAILKDSWSISSEKIPVLYNILSIPRYNANTLQSIVPEKRRELSTRKYNEDECEICFEKPIYKTMVSCCNHIFCGRCIVKQMSIKSSCPICRERIDEKSLYYIDNMDMIPNVKTKVDTCVDIINKNAGSKVMIYSMFESSLIQIVNRCKTTDPSIYYTYFNSHPLSNNNMLKIFIENKGTSLLCISSLDNIQGMSIPCISHIVFLHDIIFHEERETIISIARCMKRNSPLNIMFLDEDL